MTNLPCNTKQIFDGNFLSCFYENIDGISAHKCDDILTSSSSCDYNVIALTETWLNGSINNNEFISDRYSVYRKDREQSSVKEKRGGGVLIAIRTEIHSELYTNDKMNDLEAVCVKIPLPSGYIYVYCLYIQPSATIDTYRAHVGAVEQLQRDASVNDMILILGDFNLGSAASWKSNDDGFDFIPSIGESTCRKANIAREITSSMTNLCLSQMSDFKNKFTNVLDLIYSNTPELTVVSKADFLIIPSEKSDDAHVPLMCTVECSPKVLPVGDSNSTFCFKRANFDQIREHLSNLDLVKAMNHTTDVNEMTSILYAAIFNTFELFVPRAVIRSTNKPIWHNKELSSLKNNRNKEYKKICDRRQKYPDADENSFLNAKINFEKYRRQLHNDFIRDKASSLKSDSKSLWKFIND